MFVWTICRIDVKYGTDEFLKFEQAYSIGFGSAKYSTWQGTLGDLYRIYGTYLFVKLDECWLEQLSEVGILMVRVLHVTQTLAQVGLLS